MSIKVLSTLALIPLALAGCMKSSMSSDTRKEAKEHTAPLACGGKIKNVTVPGLAKAEGSNGLYEAQMYSRPTSKRSSKFNFKIPYALV